MTIRSKIIIKKALFIMFLFLIPGLGVYFSTRSVTNLVAPVLIKLGGIDIEKMPTQMADFSDRHQNRDSGLFVAPTFEANYYAMYDAMFNVSDPMDIAPLGIPSTEDTHDSTFMFEYFLKKQNLIDGGFADSGTGVSMIETTYHGIKILEKLNANYIKEKKMDITNLVNLEKYINGCHNEADWGFRSTPTQEQQISFDDFFYTETANQSQLALDQSLTIAQESDLSSTRYGLEYASEFQPSLIQTPQAMKNYTDSCYIDGFFLGGGYVPHNKTIIISPKSTYDAVRCDQILNESYGLTSLNTIGRKAQIKIYFDLLYNATDGGYMAFPGNGTDIVSTFYIVATSKILGIPLVDTAKTANFSLNCQNFDGGFAVHPINKSNNVPKSDWEGSRLQYGWAALQILNLTNTLLSVSENASIILPYLAWKHQYQGKGGLFGYITMETQYYGVLSMLSADPNLISRLNGQNITKFVQECYNTDGGYGSSPEAGSSLYSTFCAIETLLALKSQTKLELPNVDPTGLYIVGLQNNDTDKGFRMGNNSLTEFMPISIPEIAMLDGMLDKNASTSEATFWAISVLIQLNRTSWANTTGAAKFVRSNQAADGGFSALRSYRSDIISTYYAVLCLDLLNVEIPSETALLEFVKGAQSPSGTFFINPLLAEYMPLYPFLTVNYMAWKVLNSRKELPVYPLEGATWLIMCIDFNNLMADKPAGAGDYVGFGGDIRNMIMGVDIVHFAQEIYITNPTPYQNFFNNLLIFETIILIIWVFFTILSAILKALRIGGSRLAEEKAYLAKFPAVDVEDMTVFAGKKVIINKMSLRLENGEILGVLGESGAGKSTFVKALLGMRQYTGKVRIFGYDPKKDSRKLKRIFGYVPQDLSKLYDNFTVMENLIVFGQQYGLKAEEIIQRGKIILRSLQIGQKEMELVHNLSGGQKRRVSIAIALIHEPVLCILDEPTSGLDPVVREDLWLSLVELNERLNTTLIVITHYPEESRFCNKVAIFGRKKGMIDFGEPNDLLALLPGNGRAIELKFANQILDAANTMMKIPDIDRVLERNLGKEFVIFSNLNLDQVQQRVLQTFPGASIEYIGQTDARMEDFFRYRFLEVII